MDFWKFKFDRADSPGKKGATAPTLADDIMVFDDGYLAGRNPLNPEGSPPICVDARVYLLCKEGEMTLNADYRIFRLTKGALFRLNGRHHIIDDIHISNDYKGYFLVFSHDFIRSITNRIPGLTELTARADDIWSLMELDEAELRKFVGIIERLKENLRATTHTFHSQIVRIEATNFILELADRFARKMPDKQDKTGKADRGEETFRQFMQLIMDNCKLRHEVSFYADRLNMTPGNLSRIITKVGRKPPIKWISEALVAEAKVLLQKPGMNVQEVSHELNFGDQSSFGKFFRKHTGLTPIAYKNRIRQIELF